MRYGGGVEETWGPLDEMSFSRNGEKGGRVLLFIAIANVLSDREEVGVAETVLIGGIGSIGDRIPLSCDVGRMGRLTSRLSHGLKGGVVFTVGVVAETRVLESVFVLGGVNVSLR